MKLCMRLAIVVCALFLLSCATTGPGGQKSLILVSTAQEVSIGQGMADQLAKTEKRLPDEAWQKYLNDVGQKLVAVCDRTDIKYSFTVIESDQMNAFAAPGGFVYFYSALLRKMDNEGEMAAVMAHEISHVVARHGIKRLQTSLGAAMAYQLVFGDKGGEAFQAAISVGMGLLFADYSRDNEREADKFGIYYMQKAGYDPNAAITMFEKLATLGGSGGSDVFERLSSSHPETAERITNAKAEIATMGKLPAGLTLGQKKYHDMRAKLPDVKPAATKK